MTGQLRKYLKDLYVNATILFNENLPTDQKLSFKIMKLMITKGNLNWIQNETTYEHLNHLSGEEN